jgi:hypothetical protein
MKAIKDYWQDLKIDLGKSYRDEDNLALFFRNSNPLCERMYNQMMARRPYFTTAFLLTTASATLYTACAIAQADSLESVISGFHEMPRYLLQLAEQGTCAALQSVSSSIC